jgi:hypothetical protein
MNAIAELSGFAALSDDYQISSVENRLPDNHVDVNKRRYSRMDERFRVVDEQLRELAKHRRADGAPPVPVSSLGKVIEQTPLGASQSGHQASLPEDCALTDFCVAQLPAIKRLVHDAEYDHCVGQSKEEKRYYLKRKHGVRMSNTAWDHNLQGVREMVMVLRKSIVKLLAAEEPINKV